MTKLLRNGLIGSLLISLAAGGYFALSSTSKATYIPQPPQFYVEAAKHKVQSKLTFDQIAARVSAFQHNVSETGKPSEIRAYVFFDPLCEFCAKLSMNMMSPDAIHIVDNIAWVPVGYLKEFSTLQGAALIGSESPALAMTAHAANVLKGEGKEYALNVRMAKQEDIDRIVENTKVWSDSGAAQVPFIVTKDPQGKTLSIYGAIEGFQMAEFLSKPRF